MLQGNHSFKITLEMRSWGWWGSAWFRQMKTTSESHGWCAMSQPVPSKQPMEGCKKFLMISKKRCACLLMTVSERPTSEPESSFFFPNVLGQIPPFSIYLSHSSSRVYSKRECSDVSDPSRLKPINPPHNFNFLYTVYRQLREIVNT